MKTSATPPPETFWTALNKDAQFGRNKNNCGNSKLKRKQLLIQPNEIQTVASYHTWYLQLFYNFYFVFFTHYLWNFFLEALWLVL